MNSKPSKSKKIRVGILDDHQGTLDGYAYRLTPYPQIEVTASARFGSQLEEMVAAKEIDVLLLDVGVPSAENDPSPYPLLYLLPRFRDKYPAMAILIISMHKHPTLVKAVMEAGAKGYILKDDHEAILKLGEIITSVAAGGVYFSQQSFDMLSNRVSAEDVQLLTQRQREALSLAASKPEMTMDDLAAELQIAGSTLRNLLSDSYKRLKARNLAAAIIKARSLGMITPFPPEPKTEA